MVGNLRRVCIVLTVATCLDMAYAIAAERVTTPDKNRGATASSTLTLLDSEAMNHMLRADRDKDGMLSREELEQYDRSLARRFKEADSDRDGRLTLYEFEKLVSPRQATAGAR